MRRTLVAAINNYGKFVSNADELPTQVLTIHASKGQESEQVVLYDGITRTVAQSMRDNAEACRNEYRTWYVALTRAKERLHLMRGAFDWTGEFLPAGLLETVCDALQPDGDEGAEEVVS
jgi:DNA helicase-2/ATP-dependent DNA helicase PcrA